MMLVSSFSSFSLIINPKISFTLATYNRDARAQISSQKYETYSFNDSSERLTRQVKSATRWYAIVVWGGVTA